MSVSKAELEAIGIKKQPLVAIPEEWKQVGGYREIKGKDGKEYIVLTFQRPNEPDIELWAHSLQVVDGKLCADPAHVERQDALSHGKRL